MKDSEEIKDLLTEIRDVQREHLSAYREVTQRSLELQQQAVIRQEQIGKLYQRVIMTAAIIVGFIVIVIIYLLSKFR